MNVRTTAWDSVRTAGGDFSAGGIGISNVHERLRLLYGNEFKMDIRSARKGRGRKFTSKVPELATAEPFAGL